MVDVISHHNPPVPLGREEDIRTGGNGVVLTHFIVVSKSSDICKRYLKAKDIDWAKLTGRNLSGRSTQREAVL